MASANLDLVRSIYDAWEHGDFGSAEWAHPEIEFVIADGPEPGSWKGLAGLSEGWRAVLGAWENLRIESEDYRELDGDRVLVLLRLTGRGKTSGLELEQVRTRGVNLFHMTGDTVTSIVHYFDGEQALLDLGVAADTD
jgi:hypothetical protein